LIYISDLGRWRDVSALSGGVIPQGVSTLVHVAVIVPRPATPDQVRGDSPAPRR
jgi:hypothetical protein